MVCRGKSSTRCRKSGSVPVYLNVYDLTSINGCAYWLGLGVYHSGVQGLIFMLTSKLILERKFGSLTGHSSTDHIHTQ
ncbi:hypothetical protein R6Q57_002070 [Mikania cordata]